MNNADALTGSCRWLWKNVKQCPSVPHSRAQTKWSPPQLKHSMDLPWKQKNEHEREWKLLQFFKYKNNKVYFVKWKHLRMLPKLPRSSGTSNTSNLQLGGDTSLRLHPFKPCPCSCPFCRPLGNREPCGRLIKFIKTAKWQQTVPKLQGVSFRKS